ncbi:MAG: GFA family protein, partial [Gammaproteobacteria bacterium]|nr:GFA family protein [Gammaproteobacteria bacterium]
GTTRQFCKLCGSSLTFSPSSNPEGLIEISIGALDSEIPNRPDAHIFVGSKANWSTIRDDLPQYSEGRDSEKKT